MWFCFSVFYFPPLYFITDFCLYKVKLSHLKICNPRRKYLPILVETSEVGQLLGGGAQLFWDSHGNFLLFANICRLALWQGEPHSRMNFYLAGPWIPVSQHTSLLSGLLESPDTYEICTQMPHLPFWSLFSHTQRWGLYGITGGPELAVSICVTQLNI